MVTEGYLWPKAMCWVIIFCRSSCGSAYLPRVAMVVDVDRPLGHGQIRIGQVQIGAERGGEQRGLQVPLFFERPGDRPEKEVGVRASTDGAVGAQDRLAGMELLDHAGEGALALLAFRCGQSAPVRAHFEEAVADELPPL